jgi:quinol-cytochrome oxidoreductase complex cytochrome b subunit
MTYAVISKAERKRLTAEIYRDRPIFRVLQIGIMVVSAVLGRWIASASVSRSTHYGLFVAVLLSTTFVIALALWGALMAPFLRREIAKRTRA